MQKNIAIMEPKYIVFVEDQMMAQEWYDAMIVMNGFMSGKLLMNNMYHQKRIADQIDILSLL